MSGYNDGSSFGYDEINPYEYIPISFEQSQIGDRPFLLSRDEYPRFSAKPTSQVDEISPKQLTQQVRAPRGMIEGFTVNSDDQHSILLFLLIIIVILQVRIMMQMEYASMYSLYPRISN